MSSLGINFSGLASGLDTSAIIEALLAVERRPIQLLEQRKTQINKQKSLFGDLKSKLDALKEASASLKGVSDFLEFTATADKDDYLKVTAGKSAAKGTYDLVVDSLAKGQINQSAAKADKDITTYGGGSLYITVDADGPSPVTHTINIDSQASTLEDIAKAINAKGIEVQATVLDTGIGTNRYRLVLTGTETGSEHDFSVSAGEGALKTLAQEIDGNTVQAATNAQLRVNGISIERSSNSITDAIEGLTIDLNAARSTSGTPTAAETTKITVGANSTATAEKVKKFIDAYNDVVDFVGGQNEIGKDGKASGVLFGDFTLRNVQQTLRSIMGSVVDNGNNNDAYSMLSLIGVTADTKGRLTLNQSKLEDAITNDSAAVRDLFSFAGSGIALRIHDAIGNYTDSVDGLITSRTQAFDNQIRRADNEITLKERQLELFEQQQRSRFAALESLMSQLQSQGAALSAFQTPTR